MARQWAVPSSARSLRLTKGFDEPLHPTQALSPAGRPGSCICMARMCAACSDSCGAFRGRTLALGASHLHESSASADPGDGTCRFCKPEARVAAGLHERRALARCSRDSGLRGWDLWADRLRRGADSTIRSPGCHSGSWRLLRAGCSGWSASSGANRGETVDKAPSRHELHRKVVDKSVASHWAGRLS